MTTATFDTHRFIKKMTAEQFTEKQAETIVEAIREANGVEREISPLKHDTERFRSEMKTDFATLEHTMQADLKDVKSDLLKLAEMNKKDLELTKREIIISVGGMVFALAGFIKFFVH